MNAPPQHLRYTFPPSHRIGGITAFRAVFDNGQKVSRGPLTLYFKANDLGHPRLGMTVSRRVGKAVRRNAIKRKLREAYRLGRHDFPPLDLVFVVRPHRPMPLSTYQEIVAKLVKKAAERLRSARPSSPSASPAPPPGS